MEIWRIHLKPDEHKGIESSRQFCIDRGIVGVGWPIDYTTTPVSWEEYEKAVYEKAATDEYYRKWRMAVGTIKNNMQNDDLVWTRDKKGRYFLGRVTGEWYYDTSNENAKVNIVNVRKCEWHEIGTVDKIPGRVVTNFVRGQTVRRIKSDTVRIFSQIMYNQKSNGDFLYKDKDIDDLSDKNIFDLLSPDDCEDALAIYLQVLRGYYLIPSSCKKDTVHYEYALKNKKTGKLAFAQVKSGRNDSLNPDNFSELAKPDIDVYLFATSGDYEEGTSKANIETIEPEKIRKFIYEHADILPDKIKVWVELTRPKS